VRRPRGHRRGGRCVVARRAGLPSERLTTSIHTWDRVVSPAENPSLKTGASASHRYVCSDGTNGPEIAVASNKTRRIGVPAVSSLTQAAIPTGGVQRVAQDRMLRLRRARDPVGGRWYVQALLRVFLYPPPCGIIAETSYDVTLRRYARTPRI